MPHAVEMYLDEAATRLIVEAWETLDRVGIPSRMLHAGYRPHVSLAVAVAVRDPESLVRALVPRVSRLPLRFMEIGVFRNPGVLYLAPEPSPDLREAHVDAFRIVEPYASAMSELYAPRNWVPHCTMSFGLDSHQLDAATTVCAQLLPLAAKVSSVGITDVGPTHARTLAEAL